MINQKYKSPYFWIVISLMAWFLFGINISYAEGGLSLSQTRVIFNAKSKSAKVMLNNKSDGVYLVSSRVQATPDANSQSGQAMPFVITPPLFRLEKESVSAVLISRNNTSMLPTDRESVFYLSFLAIPSVKKKGEIDPELKDSIGSPQVSFGVRTVIKLFYRPSGLSMSAEEAQQKLTFSQQGSKLMVSNPTPYYITLGHLILDGKPVNVRDQGPMIEPFSTYTYTLEESVKAKKIQWSVINDFGGLSDLSERS